MTFRRSPFGSQSPRVPSNTTDGDVRAQVRDAVDAVESDSALLRRVGRLPAHALLLLIRTYQRTVAPILPVVTLGRCGCRFAPTCSQYAAEAIRIHGALAGTFLAALRLVKCTPLHPGGFDPVPPPRRKPRCDRIAA